MVTLQRIEGLPKKKGAYHIDRESVPDTLGCSFRTLWRHLQKLEVDGIVEVDTAEKGVIKVTTMRRVFAKPTVLSCQMKNSDEILDINLDISDTDLDKVDIAFDKFREDDIFYDSFDTFLDTSDKQDIHKSIFENHQGSPMNICTNANMLAHTANELIKNMGGVAKNMESVYGFLMGRLLSYLSIRVIHIPLEKAFIEELQKRTPTMNEAGFLEDLGMLITKFGFEVFYLLLLKYSIINNNTNNNILDDFRRPENSPEPDTPQSFSDGYRLQSDSLPNIPPPPPPKSECAAVTEIQSPIPKQEPDLLGGKAPKPEYSEDFLEFYSVCIHKEKKGDSYKLWKAMKRKKMPMGLIKPSYLAFIEQEKRNGKDEQYIIRPYRFLKELYEQPEKLVPIVAEVNQPKAVVESNKDADDFMKAWR